jgi:hypothetical protein
MSTMTENPILALARRQLLPVAKQSNTVISFEIYGYFGLNALTDWQHPSVIAERRNNHLDTSSTAARSQNGIAERTTFRSSTTNAKSMHLDRSFAVRRHLTAPSACNS